MTSAVPDIITEVPQPHNKVYTTVIYIIFGALALFWEWIWPIAQWIVYALACIYATAGIVYVSQLYATRKYLRSEQFTSVRNELAELTREHNQISDHAESLRHASHMQLGYSETGRHAHMSQFVNKSVWNYKRKRKDADYVPTTHEASLTVLKNARREPVKYFVKYFCRGTDEEILRDTQNLLQQMANLKDAIDNLELRESALLRSASPPKYVTNRFQSEFWTALGARIPNIDMPYQAYQFAYESPAGRVEESAPFVLDLEQLESLSEFLEERIHRRRSIKGQRALMTRAIREQVKHRDGYACRQCGVSVDDEPHLLLEVDHIQPLSKGGLSTWDNLQTLCWKCNRSKGSRYTHWNR